VSAPLLIVGGGPAGLATARGYREAGGDGAVLMLTADDRPPYRRPPLTKELLRGEVGETDLPIVPEAWYREHEVEVRCREAVEELDAGTRAVTTASGRRLPYADCVLCTGSDPVVPPIPGADGPRVHPVRTARHGLRLARRAVPGARAAVIGAGFIGCEAAARWRCAVWR
jgi:3-phenylpropionate/trans-cinnamate dioxygenase ferredoxin reductase component